MADQQADVVPSDTWARNHARKNPGHRVREGLEDPGSCDDCAERSPIYNLPVLTMRDNTPVLPGDDKHEHDGSGCVECECNAAPWSAAGCSCPGGFS